MRTAPTTVALALVFWLAPVGLPDDRPSHDVCMDAALREHVRKLMVEALDAAMKEHIVRLYETWLKDPQGQPARAAAGIRNGLENYRDAYLAATTWAPPLCPDERESR
jgi:hypothetical protein